MELEIFGYRISIHPMTKFKVFEIRVSYDGEYHLNAIKTLRSVYFDTFGDQMGLVEAKNLIDGKDSVFITIDTKAKADDICRKLGNMGIGTKIVEIVK